MKICVVSSTVFPCPPSGYSGLEHLAWLQAKGLAERGHEVFLVAPDESTCPGVTIIPTGPAGRHDEGHAYNLYWQHLLTVDAVIDNSWTKPAYILKMEGRLKAPVLGVMHAPVNTMYQTLPNVELPCFVCISKDQASHFEALFGRDCKFVYNGCCPGFYRPLDLPRTNRFLFLARFSSVKAPHTAIEACLKAGVGLDLIGDTSITGEPDYLRMCFDMARQHSPDWNPARGQQIRLVGGVSRGETVHWYSRAHCMIHPTHSFREPFGLAPCEAMLCHCPVISWRYGACRETVKDGVSGWQVKTMDQLVTAIQVAARGIPHEMRVSAREWAMQFSVEAMVNGYQSLVEEAVQTGGW